MCLRHQQQQLFCLFFIFITQLASSPIRSNLHIIRCDIHHQNCTLHQRNLSSITRFSTSSWSKLSTSGIRSTTKTNSLNDDFDAFSENLKRAALILAGIALGLGILRVCLMLCKSRSRNNSVMDHHHSSTNRMQISTIEHQQFKPDLPPAYAEAIANMNNDGGKLPTYEELPYEQQQQQQNIYSNNNNQNQNVWISTQM